MRRLSTPTHTFTLDIDMMIVKTIRIVYAQDDSVILVKRGDDVLIDGNTVSVRLTQEETRLFSASSTVSIQLDILTTDGDVLHSDIIKTLVQDVLLDEVVE